MTRIHFHSWPSPEERLTSNKPPVENHFREKYKRDEHVPLLNDIKLIDIGDSIPSSTKELKAANDLNPIILDEIPHFLELNELNRPLSCPSTLVRLTGYRVKSSNLMMRI